MYTFVYDVSLNRLAFVVLRNLDGFEPWFAFDYTNFDGCNLLGGVEEVNFFKIITCAFK